jgi:2-dehydropantoate 2-reductase
MMQEKRNLSSAPLPVAVMGTGAIGGFYGLLLARAKLDVHFLLRSDYAVVAKQGMSLQSKMLGNIRSEKVNAYRDAGAMPRCEWLLVGTKATSNAGLAPLIERVALPDAKVLVLQNGLNVDEQLRRLLPAHVHVLGVMCWVGVHRHGDGVIEHVALGNVEIGYHSGPSHGPVSQQAIVDSAVQLFEAAGVKALGTTDLVAARWKKLVWNIPLNGLSVLLNSGTQAIMSNPDSRQLVREMILEVTAGAALCGHRLPDELPDQALAVTDSIPDYLPSMYHDNAERRPMELDVMYQAPLEAVKAAGGSMPRVEALYQALRFLDARNRDPA